jgi:hypothetical protein
MPKTLRATYHFVQEREVPTELDPKLQNVILEQSGRAIPGMPLLATAATTISAVARLKNGVIPQHFRASAVIGDIAAGDLDVIAITEVRGNVESLKLAQPLAEAADVAELNCTPQQIQAAISAASATSMPSGDVTGKGVIIGIVDAGGFDAVHPNFRGAGGKTRLLSLWDQNGSGTPPQPYDYGREYLAAEIDGALAACPVGPSVCASFKMLRVPVESGGHGTRVADIAAGNGVSPRTGVAPRADIIFVQLQSEATANTSAGTWRHVIDGVDYIFKKAIALGKQAVINLSLEVNGGPHDDQSLIERALNEFVKSEGRAIVVAAGNSRNTKQHASGSVQPSGSFSVDCALGTVSSEASDIEIWYPSTGSLAVELKSSAGTVIGGSVRLDETHTIESADGTIIGRVHHRKDDPNNGDNLIEIVFGTDATGTWTITLNSLSLTEVKFDAWITGPKAVFGGGATTEHTVNGMAGSGTVCVGAHASTPKKALLAASAEGPNRRGILKPDLVAPGVNVLTATATKSSLQATSGTSVSAPHIAGLIALMMQAAGRTLSNGQIRSALLSHTSRTVWDPREGFGRVNGAAAILAVVSKTNP